MLTHAPQFCLASAGVFFLAGLLTGAWKYARMVRSADGQAPHYVDTAHRSSLLYAFACALLAQFCGASAWSNAVNLAAAAVLVAYFGLAVLTYLVHGLLGDTDNQLKRPHRLGSRLVPPWAVTAFMLSLIAAEVGSFLVVFSGYLVTAAG